MPLELCILASGSAGNSAVLRCPSGSILIDAGIGPRTAARRLDGTGVALADVSAVCLTHLDCDHFNPNWLRTILSAGIRVMCHQSRVGDILRIVHDAQTGPDAATRRQRVDDLAGLLEPFEAGPFAPLEGLRLTPQPLAHDRHGSHGFAIEGFGGRIGYATDLGAVPDDLLDLFCELDVLAMESNYDPDMQMNSARPWHLKQRIMGGRGHLSNVQALAAIGRILDRCDRNRRPLPAHIVLLHRSRECNCPKLLRQTFEADPRIAARLTLAEQSQRTEWLRARTARPRLGEQLALSWAGADLA